MDYDTRETWRFINSFAPWASAIGSFLASIVALYLSRRGRHIRLMVMVSYRHNVVPNPKEQHLVVINVTNIEPRPATITGIYWKIGIFRKDIVEESPLGLADHSYDFTKELRDGDSVEYRMFAWQCRRAALEIRQLRPRVLSRVLRRTWLRNMKVGIITSTGKKFEKRIDYYLRHWLIEEPRYTRFEKQ
jgi:hypothetical protein